MPIHMQPDIERALLYSIKRFFLEELEQDIGDLKAAAVLEFFVREVAPSVYNQAIADAQTYLERAISDLGGVQFVPEFDYWKQR